MTQAGSVAANKNKSTQLTMVGTVAAKDVRCWPVAMTNNTSRTLNPLGAGRLVVTATLLALITAGCTDQATDRSSTPSSPSPASAASPDPQTAGRDAIAAYRRMWQAYQEAMAIPDPAYSDLARYAHGEALEILTKGVQSTKDGGLKGTGKVVLSPEVTSVAPVEVPTEVKITDCMDSSGSHIVRASPGPPYSDAPGGRSRTTATVRWQPAGWKVTSFGVQEAGTC